MADIAQATVLADIRSMLNEPTAQFFTDTEINSWIDKAADVLSVRSLCYEVDSTTFQLATSQEAYTYNASGSDIGDISAVKIESVIYMGDAADTNGSDSESLAKITPVQMHHLSGDTSGLPRFWTAVKNTIYLYPEPSATYNSDYMRVLYYKQTGDYSANYLPDYIQETVIYWVLARAYEKDGKMEQAAMYQRIFDVFADFYRQVRYVKHVDSRDMMKQADYTKIG